MITYKKSGLLLPLLLAAFCFLAGEAHAIFTLSVTPRRGGRDIQFEQSQPGQLLRNEEVTVAVTTDEGVQYHLFLFSTEPLTNELGEVIPQGNFIVFSPSSPLGKLQTKLETPITMGQQQFYTSNAAGDSDSFVLVFNVRVPENQASGTYRTRLSFIAEPVDVGSGVSQKVVNVDVRVQIRPQFRLAIRETAGGNQLDFDRITEARKESRKTLLFEIDSNLSETYRIVQQVTEPMTSGKGEFLEDSAITFTAVGNKKGALEAEGTPRKLSSSPQVIYTSSDRGEGDVFEVQYTLSPESLQRAGRYAGALNFRVESGSVYAPTGVFHVPVSLEIEPLLYLDIEMEQGSQIAFGKFGKSKEKEVRQVTIRIHSNMGEPYQVTQILATPLTNEKGRVLPKENFTYYGTETKTGQLKAVSPTGVPEGESVIFTSDAKGTPEEIKLIYSLTIPEETAIGSYRSNLKYSANTL